MFSYKKSIKPLIPLIIAVLAIPALVFLPGFTKGNSPWIELPIEPVERFNYSCVLGSDDLIYCMGGQKVTQGTFGPADDNYAYDPSSGTWAEKASIPDDSHGSVMANVFLVSVDGKIYAFHHHDMYNTGQLKYYIYDVEENTWDDNPEEYSIGANRYRVIAVAEHDGLIYLLGEYRSGEEGDTQRYLRLSSLNPDTDTWTENVHSMEISAENIRRDNSYAVIGGKIYIFAGQDGTGVWRRSMLVYDIEENTLAAKADIPTFRQDGAVFVGSDGKIYVLGGVPVPEELMDGVKTRTSVSYTPSTNSWATEAPISEENSHHQAVLATDNNVYVFMQGLEGESLPPLSERPILDYYINQTYDVSYNIDPEKGIYKAYAPSLEVALCPPNFQRCNYHITPGIANRSFDLSPVISNGRLVATPMEFSMATMAFLAPVGDTVERITLRFAPNVSISGSTDWDGIFHFPSLLSEPSVSPAGSGVDIDKVVKLGGNVGLTLSAPARLMIPGGGANYRVGYIEPGSSEFVEITKICNEDTLEAVTEQLGEGEACKIVIASPEDMDPEYVEPDSLAIWTTHFTEFVTYQAETPADETSEEDSEPSLVTELEEDEVILPRTGGGRK